MISSSAVLALLLSPGVYAIGRRLPRRIRDGRARRTRRHAPWLRWC
jgi:hypothetical protein